jgi:voltage-gated potassium channel
MMQGRHPHPRAKSLTESARGGRPERRVVIATAVKVLLSTSILVALYALAPLDRRPVGLVAVELIVSLLLLAALLGWQITSVIRSPYPGLRAAEAVAVTLPLIILLFSAAYFVMEEASSGTFTEPLTRIDALYFTVTVFASVGFGDITPKTEVARMIVTLQMIVDLALIGVIAKVLLGAVQQRRQTIRRSTQ